MFTLRDLVYLDRQRIRRLLAQVDGGVLEQVIERSSEGATQRRAVHLLRTVDLERTLADKADVERTVTFEDALLDLLETSLDELGWITDVDGLDDPQAWDEGEVHRQLAPGAIVRLSGLTQVLDPAFIRASVDRSMAAMEQMAVFITGGLEAAARSKSERNRIGRQGAQKLMGGLPPDAARQMADVFVAFFGEGLIVRHLPCGPEHRAFALLGTLADGPEFMADSREALFAKYGSAPSEWTMLGQIASVPAPPAEEDAVPDDEEEDEEAVPDRAHFEGIAAGILRSLEESGLTGAPAWPSITLTPIALYRPRGRG